MMKWIPFYPSDFLGATIGLSHTERSTYALMLVMYYELKAPFPADKVEAYRILGCESDEQKRVVDKLLGRFFVMCEDGWYQERCEKILAETAAFYQQKVLAGKKSARARMQKYGTNQPIYPNDRSNDARTTPERPSEPTTTTTTTISKPKPPFIPPQKFDTAPPPEKDQPPLTPQGGGSEVQGIPEPKTPEPKKRGRTRNPAMTFGTFVEQLKATGQKAISDYKPVLDYARQIKLPSEFLLLYWQEYKRRHLPGGTEERRRQADWRLAFLRHLQANYYRIWYYDNASGQFVLSTNGHAAQRATT